MPLEIRGAHFLIRSAQLVRGTRLEKALPQGRRQSSRTPSLVINLQRLQVISVNCGSALHWDQKASFTGMCASAPDLTEQRW